MSTNARHFAPASLPSTGRGDALFAGVAVLIAVLALALKLAGVFE